VAAVTAVLEDFDAHPERVRRLTNGGWIHAAFLTILRRDQTELV